MEMKLLDAYDIPWKGLSNGCHDFDFEIDDRFFGEFGDSGIQGGRMKAEVRMEKSAAMLLLHVTIEGEVTVECDRCLGDLRLPVNYTGDLTVKFSDETEDYDGAVMWLNPAEEKVPLAQYIYESIVLSLPYRKVHGTGPDGEPLCDKEMLARFRIISQAEFDALETEQHSLADTDEGGKLQQLMQELEKGEDKE